ncbi:MAG: FixH family protein [Niabella sp.]
MSWGYRVIIILSLFVAGILTMVYIAMQQDNEMIDDKYYDKELQYQSVIDARENLEKYNDSILVTEDEGMVKIKIPIEASKNISEGYIEFLRHDDKNKDRKLKLETDTAGFQALPKSNFTKGVYKLRARWKSDGVEYYDERLVTMQ